MRRTIAAIGRTLLTLGLLILLFVAYQLWGTGVFTARAQARLEKDFARAKAQYEASTVDTVPTTAKRPRGSTTSTTSPTRPAPPPPAVGQPDGRIRIPKIHVDFTIIEGTDRDQLNEGPGHYPDTPLPGTFGNAAIAGHRTTYAHPFGDLDHLAVGDDIFVDTLWGSFTYEVIAPDDMGHPWATKDGGHLIVRKNDTWVVANTADARLTLTSCHPKGSAENRIVVKAKLVANKSMKPKKPQAPRKTAGGKAKPVEATLQEGLSGQQRSLAPAIGWGFVAAYVGLAWWWVFRRWRHPITWIVGVIPFLVALAPFYVYLERALPAGY